MTRTSPVLCAVAVSLMLSLSPPPARCAAAASQACNGSTAEQTRGPAFAAQATQFLHRLQQVVRSQDRNQFAAMTEYPVLLIDSHRKTKIRSAAALAQRYPSIMTLEMRKAILGQSAACLFANDQGAMIGNGQIWFERQADGKMKIITINLTAPEH